MSAERDGTETRQTMALIHAMAKRGPTRWAGNPPIQKKDDQPRHEGWQKTEGVTK